MEGKSLEVINRIKSWCIAWMQMVLLITNDQELSLDASPGTAQRVTGLPSDRLPGPGINKH